MDEWARFESDLSRHLREMPDATHLWVTGPPRPKPSAAPWWWPGREKQVPFRARFNRHGDLLYADLLGGPQMGAEFPWTDPEHAALQKVGWSPPDPPPPLKGPYLRVYERRFEGFLDPGGLPEAVAREAAGLVIRTLREVVRATPQQVRIEQR